MKSINSSNNGVITSPTNITSNTIKKLTKDDIIETTGITQTDTIEELEILFLTCDEISSLQYCRNLKALSMVDNGLKRISNLTPVRNTLIKLCLCDQLIVKIENLDLPNLKELYLHRNRIEHIEGLKGNYYDTTSTVIITLLSQLISKLPFPITTFTFLY
jgi:centrosomal protein CEP97